MWMSDKRNEDEEIEKELKENIWSWKGYEEIMREEREI